VIYSPATRVFKTRQFSRWVRRTALSDATLCEAVSEMQRGLLDADLGGGVLKKRVALPGRGKSGGARTLVATNRADRWFFVFGFAKNERASVSGEELEALQALAADLLKLAAKELDTLIGTGALQEICHDRKDPAEEPDPGRGSRDCA
jgi:hypothetical protein